MVTAGSKDRASKRQGDGLGLEARVKQLRSAGGNSKNALAGVQELFEAHLTTNAALVSVRALDSAKFLEDVLWPCVASSAAASAPQQKALVLSVLMLANEQLRLRGVAAWSFLVDDASQWEAFVAQLLALARDDWSAWEKSHLVQFLTHCYQSLDVPAIAKVLVALRSANGSKAEALALTAFAEE